MESNRGDSSEMKAQTPPSGPTLCQTGCGFYAHSAFDGMCSKCYKDHAMNSSTSSTSTNATSLLTKGSMLNTLLHTCFCFFPTIFFVCQELRTNFNQQCMCRVCMCVRCCHIIYISGTLLNCYM